MSDPKKTPEKSPRPDARGCGDRRLAMWPVSFNCGERLLTR